MKPKMFSTGNNNILLNDVGFVLSAMQENGRKQHIYMLINIDDQPYKLIVKLNSENFKKLRKKAENVLQHQMFNWNQN